MPFLVYVSPSEHHPTQNRHFFFFFTPSLNQVLNLFSVFVGSPWRQGLCAWPSGQLHFQCHHLCGGYRPWHHHRYQQPVEMYTIVTTISLYYKHKDECCEFNGKLLYCHLVDKFGKATLSWLLPTKTLPGSFCSLLICNIRNSVFCSQRRRLLASPGSRKL